MIPEVDHALRTLIEREAIDPAEVEVEFDAPTKEWASRRNAPTIDVYLYDIREDLRRRERGWLNEYDGNRILARHLPPRYFKLSYLVAAWTQRPEDEHRLLATLMGCFLRYEALPTDVLTGSLAGPRSSGAGHCRVAAARGSVVRRCLDRAGRRAETVAGRRRHGTDRHRTVVPRRARRSKSRRC